MRLNISDKGQGEVIVLIHGLLGSLDNLNMVARAFHKTHRVISVDLRNHGSSSHHADMSYATLANDVLETLDELEVTEFDLLGHSMGGKVAMLLALNEPQRVKRLIVADIAPTTYPERHNEIFTGLNSIPLAQISNRNDADEHLSKHVAEPGIRQFLLRNLSKSDSGFRWKMNLSHIIANYHHVIGFPDINSQFNKPCLFIIGSESNYVDKSHQTRIASLFPQVKAKVIQGAGHWLHAEKTLIFNKLLRNFIEQ